MPKTIEELKNIANDKERYKRIWDFMVKISDTQLQEQVEDFSKRTKVNHEALYTESK